MIISPKIAKKILSDRLWLCDIRIQEYLFILFICSLFNGSHSLVIQRGTVRWLVNNELIRIWKKSILALIKFYPSICLEKLRETTRSPLTIISVRAEIRIGGLHNTGCLKNALILTFVNPLFPVIRSVWNMMVISLSIEENAGTRLMFCDVHH
jgi:hypothetical protein